MRRQESKFLGRSSLSAATGFSVALHAALIAFGICASEGGEAGSATIGRGASAPPLRIEIVAQELAFAVSDAAPLRPDEATSALEGLEAAGSADPAAQPPSIADEADPDWTPERPSFLDVVEVAPLDDRLAVTSDLARQRPQRAPSPTVAQPESTSETPVIALQPSPSVKTEAKTTAAAPAAGAKATRVKAAPDPKFCKKPAFPRRAAERGLKGTVLLRIDLDEFGVPIHVLVSKSSGHEILDDAALAAVRRWRFLPARDDGRAVASTVLLPIEFKDPPG